MRRALDFKLVACIVFFSLLVECPCVRARGPVEAVRRRRPPAAMFTFTPGPLLYKCACVWFLGCVHSELSGRSSAHWCNHTHPRSPRQTPALARARRPVNVSLLPDTRALFRCRFIPRCARLINSRIQERTPWQGLCCPRSCFSHINEHITVTVSASFPTLSYMVLVEAIELVLILNGNVCKLTHFYPYCPWLLSVSFVLLWQLFLQWLPTAGFDPSCTLSTQLTAMNAMNVNVFTVIDILVFFFYPLTSFSLHWHKQTTF